MSVNPITGYTVRAGDSFWSIGQKLGVSAEALEAANPGISADTLRVGQVLRLPSGGSHPYTIVQGDTLWAIAKRFGTSVDALETANPGIVATHLETGQIITIPGSDAGPGPSSDGEYVTYSGPASAYPDPTQWVSYTKLWMENSRLMKLHDSDDEVAHISSAIQIVSKESGIDERVILCIIMQESGGNVRIPTVSITLYPLTRYLSELIEDRLTTLSAIPDSCSPTMALSLTRATLPVASCKWCGMVPKVRETAMA